MKQKQFMKSVRWDAKVLVNTMQDLEELRMKLYCSTEPLDSYERATLASNLTKLSVYAEELKKIVDQPTRRERLKQAIFHKK